jgi:hypothetical protein
MAQVVQYLLCKHKALSSKPDPPKKKKKKRESVTGEGSVLRDI